MGNGRVVRKIFESKQEGRKKMRRPRNRWLEKVQKICRR
jgi:hypothetical protein